MDIALVCIGLLLCFIGVIGSFLPVLPGPFTSWIGLVVLHYTDTIPMNWTFLGITLGIALFIWILDYTIPAIGTKKFGGSRYGMIGSTIGLIIGLLYMGPFGIIIGPFGGAFLGELCVQNKDTSSALRAAWGSFIGFLAGTFIKFIVAIAFLCLFLGKIWNYSDALV